MKKLLYLIVVMWGTSGFAQLQNPQSKKITQRFFQDSEAILDITPALQKKKGFTNYKELIGFIENLVDEHSDKISYSYIGKSQKGRDIPMVKMTVPNGKEKIRVFMQGGLHGNEPASTESMLYLMDRLLNDKNYSPLLENIDLAIIPMANIDGYLKNNRYAANGLDLNRDQTKLMAKESVVLKQAFTNFNPHVTVDFHEYRPYRRDYARMGDFGVTNMYDAMFLYSGNLNVPENLRNLTNEIFVENARTILDANNYKHHPYISTRKVDGDIHINQGSISARSSASNYALTNTVSSLIEIRGVGLGKTSFKRRIHSSFLIATSYLKTASENMQLVKDEIGNAIKQNNKLVVESERGVYKDDIKFIDVNSAAYTTMEMTVRDAWKAKATLTRERPKAYLIDSSAHQIIKKLKVLGITVETLKEPQTYTIESYKVKEFFRKPIRYEKMKLQTVKVEIVEQEKMFKKGTYYIPMDQKRANILAEVLEPEAPNSFVSFGIITTQDEDILPIYRLLN